MTLKGFGTRLLYDVFGNITSSWDLLVYTSRGYLDTVKMSYIIVTISMGFKVPISCGVVGVFVRVGYATRSYLLPITWYIGLAQRAGSTGRNYHWKVGLSLLAIVVIGRHAS